MIIAGTPHQLSTVLRCGGLKLQLVGTAGWRSKTGLEPQCCGPNPVDSGGERRRQTERRRQILPWPQQLPVELSLSDSAFGPSSHPVSHLHLPHPHIHHPDCSSQLAPPPLLVSSFWVVLWKTCWGRGQIYLDWRSAFWGRGLAELSQSHLD